jgi:hypothetical protein
MALAHPYHQFFNSLAAKEVNVDTDTFKMCLLTSAYVPNLATHQFQSSLTNELPSGNGYTTGGQVITGVTTGLTSANCQQTVTILGSPGSGSFTLTLAIGNNVQTTSAIGFNPTAAQVLAALVALPNVGTGNVTVTGNVGGPFTVTFVGSLGAQVIPVMTTVSALTGGSNPSVEASISTAGQGTWAITGGNAVWSSSTFTAPNAARFGVVYDSTPGSAGSNPLAGLVDFVTDQSPTNSTLSCSWDASGIVVVQIA